jgi:hypothetical protein
MCFAIFGVKGEGGVDCLFCVTNKISNPHVMASECITPNWVYYDP